MQPIKAKENTTPSNSMAFFLDIFLTFKFAPNHLAKPLSLRLMTTRLLFRLLGFCGFTVFLGSCGCVLVSDGDCSMAGSNSWCPLFGSDSKYSMFGSDSKCSKFGLDFRRFKDDLNFRLNLFNRANSRWTFVGSLLLCRLNFALFLTGCLLSSFSS